MGLARSLQRRYLEHRFTILFATLLLAIAGHAPIASLLPIANPLDWLLGLSLAAVVVSAWHGRLRWILGVLGVGFVLARLAAPMVDHSGPLFASQSAMGIACLLAAGAAMRRALTSGPVDAEHISAALDAYLLVGIAFGAGYWLLEAAMPGSFSLGSAGVMTPPRSVYFSFVTQATLGYGDMVPISEHAQGLVIVQGVGGQMYLAVLVARLVSLYSAQENR